MSLLFGFDAAVLWHIFSNKVDRKVVDSYSSLVSETVQKLRLPMVYLSSSIAETRMEIYKPILIEGYDLAGTIRYIERLCHGGRNPLREKEIHMRRNALKMALRIPPPIKSS